MPCGEVSVMLNFQFCSKARCGRARGVSNRWNGIWNGTMEWKMEWNGECTQLQLTRVAGAVLQVEHVQGSYLTMEAV